MHMAPDLCQHLKLAMQDYYIEAMKVKINEPCFYKFEMHMPPDLFSEFETCNARLLH